MRQAIELNGPGASLEELAAALGITPERQAAIRGILASQLQGKSSRNGAEHKPSANGANKKRKGRGSAPPREKKHSAALSVAARRRDRLARVT